MSEFARALIVFGIALTIIGLILSSGAQRSLIGRLPGDIYIDLGNFKFYFPLSTSIIISLIFTLLANLFKK